MIRPGPTFAYSFLRAVRIALMFVPLVLAFRLDLSSAKHTMPLASVQPKNAQTEKAPGVAQNMR